MGDRRSGRACGLHGGARHHDRQRRPALYRRRHGRQRGRSVLGGDDLSGRQRRQPDGEPFPRPPAWPQGLLPDLPRALQRELDPVRAGVESRLAAVVSNPARLGGRRHGAGVAINPGGLLPAAEARPGLRAVRRRRGCRAGGRPDARGLARRQSHLALVLPDQRSGWPGHDRADRHPAACGQAQSGACGPVRCHRLPAGGDFPRRA